MHHLATQAYTIILNELTKDRHTDMLRCVLWVHPFREAQLVHEYWLTTSLSCQTSGYVIVNAIKTRWDVFAVAVQLVTANRPQACFHNLVTCNL